MGIRFILGRTGSGKNRQIMDEIHKRLLEGGTEQLILLVPEQFTLQAEWDLITSCNLPGIIKIEVLSFTRLAHRVFDQVGGATRVVLNEQGKNMVLRRMVDNHNSELTIYKKAAAQSGFITRLGEFISDLKGQDISPNQLRDTVIGQEGMIVEQKIHDIALIYEQFSEYLRGRYLDADDHLNLLSQRIGEAKFLHNAYLWVDGFTTFSPQSLKILAQILKVVKEITVSITVDPRNGSRDSELFSLSKKSLERLRTIAKASGVNEEITSIRRSNEVGWKNPAIQHIEKELFAYPARKYKHHTKDIEIFAAANRNSEVEYAAAQVVELVRERDWRYHDLAVVCNDIDNYGPIIKRVFNEYGIPAFMDQKRSLMGNSIIKLVLSSVEVIRRGYRYEDIFTFLKTGFSGLNQNEAEIVENFALQYGIKGERWEQEICVESSELSRQLDKYRRIIIEPLKNLERKIKNKQSITAICRAHYDYLVEIGLPERLTNWISLMNQQGRLDIVRENTQIWNIILEVLDQMVEILGDQQVILKDYLHLLEAGFESLEIGIIPTTIDQVLVGDIQRSKSHDIKGLLVLGVNDGFIPSSGTEEGILTEFEKEMLQDWGLELDFERIRKPVEERFLIYTALSKPNEYLGLSYALADNEGKALRPSILINRIQNLFPGISIHSDLIKHEEIELHQIGSPQSTFKYLVENMRMLADSQPVDNIWGDVYWWYHNQDKWQPSLKSLRTALFHRNQASALGCKLAGQAYSLPLRASVSRLEQFVNCPFAHFIRYGLKPQERKVYEVAAPDIGELFHTCLRDFARQLQRENRDWTSLNRDTCDLLVDSIMDHLVPVQGNGIYASSPRYQYLAQRLKRISQRAAWILTKQLQQGEFIPKQFEVGFGPNQLFPAIEIRLGNGQQLYLEGRIDRVDLLETDEGTYIKVIDYKSGIPDFKLSNIFHGLSLQLITYLLAVLAGATGLGNGNLRPGGIFYFRIDDPLIDSTSAIIENIEKEIARQFRLQGLVLADVYLATKLDRDLPKGSSDVIPVGVKKDGEFTKNSSIITIDDLQALLAHVQGLITRIGREINSGQVRIEPIKMGNHTACRFCQYKGICQFDRALTDNRYKSLAKLSNDEVIARIRRNGGLS